MRRTRLIAAVAVLGLAVPVATAQGHPADWMYDAGNVAKQIGGKTTAGASLFMQREAALPGSFELVGSNPLWMPGMAAGAEGRGMNAAMAVHKNYVYIGSRTDAKNNNANHAGIFVVDVKDPTKPQIVHEFEGLARESSRELRVWRSQEILIVLHTNCGGNGAHQCAGNNTSFRFYDIAGEYASHPRLLYQNTLTRSSSTTSPAPTPRTRSCSTRTRATRTSSTSGRTRRTPSAPCSSRPAPAATSRSSTSRRS